MEVKSHSPYIRIEGIKTLKKKNRKNKKIKGNSKVCP